MAVGFDFFYLGMDIWYNSFLAIVRMNRENVKFQLRDIQVNKEDIK